MSKFYWRNNLSMFDDQGSGVHTSKFFISNLPYFYIATIGFYSNGLTSDGIPDGFNYINYNTTVAQPLVLKVEQVAGGFFGFYAGTRLALNVDRTSFSFYLLGNVADPTLYGYSSIPTKQELSLQMHLTKNGSPDSGYDDWNVIQFNNQIAIFYPGNDPRADEIIEIT